MRSSIDIPSLGFVQPTMATVAGPSQRRTVHPALNQPDADLLTLAAQLSIEDIEQIERHQQRLDRDNGHVSDAELALSLFAQEARNSIMFNNDRALAQALQEADPLRAPAQPRIARAAVAARPAAPTTPAPAPTATAETSLISQLGGWLWSFIAPSTSTGASSSQPRLTGHSCVICQDPIRGTEIRAPCGHYYDPGCILDLFRSATTDESLFPPRCCRQNIPIYSVRFTLPQDVVDRFFEKQTELSTPRRVYCANPRCSRFLGPVAQGWSTRPLTCPVSSCGTRTCSSCRRRLPPATSSWGLSDSSHICRPDDADARVLEIGRSSQWAQCPTCDQLIELAIGCFHMTCRCKTEFCYLCRARWKSCRCPQWDERRLLDAAEARVNAQIAAAPPRVVNAPVFRQPIRPAPVVPALPPPPPPPPPPRQPPPPPPPSRRHPSPPRPFAGVDPLPWMTMQDRAIRDVLREQHQRALGLPASRTASATATAPSANVPPTVPSLTFQTTLPSPAVYTARDSSSYLHEAVSPSPLRLVPVASSSRVPSASTADMNTTLKRNRARPFHDSTRQSSSSTASPATAPPSTVLYFEAPSSMKDLNPEERSSDIKGKKRAKDPSDSVPALVSGSGGKSSVSPVALPSHKLSKIPTGTKNDVQVQAVTTVLERIDEQINELRAPINVRFPTGRLQKKKSDLPTQATVERAAPESGSAEEDRSKRNTTNPPLARRQQQNQQSHRRPPKPAPIARPTSTVLESTTATSKTEWRMSLDLGTELSAGAAKSGIATTGESEKARGKRPAAKVPPSAPPATSGPSGITTTGESEKARGKRPAHRAPLQSPPVPTGSSEITTTGESEKAQGKRPAHNATVQSPPSVPHAPATASSSSRASGHGTAGYRPAPATQVQEPADATEAAETRTRLIREQILRLSELDDCKHNHWRTDRSGGRCDTCYHELPFYIFVCTGCQVSVCSRCRRNRF